MNKRLCVCLAAGLEAAVCAAGDLKLPEKDGEVFSRVALTSSWRSPGTGLKRSCWDFERKLDLSGGRAVSFEYRYDNPLAVSLLNVYFRTGPADTPTGWYVCNFGPTRSGWNRAVFGGELMRTHRRNLHLSGKPEGWDKITALRLSVWGPGEETTTFEVRNFRVLQPGESVPMSERRLLWTLCAGYNEEWNWPKTAAFCRTCHLTDVIARTTQIGSATYPSAYTPSDGKILSAHGDQLEKGIAACHREGLKFHAWIICWQVRGSRELIGKMKAEGRLQEPLPDPNDSSWAWPWLCPTDPRNRELLTDLAAELAARGADGVHLDYIRHNARRGCFCTRCRAGFETRLGRKVANWPKDVAEGGCDMKAWDGFRSEQVTALVRSIRARLKAESPQVELSAAVQAHPECVNSAQDWLGWCREGLVDFLSPMDYRSSPAFLRLDLAQQQPILKETGVAIYPGIGVAASGLQLSEWDVARQIDLIREMDFPGYTFFWLLKGNARVYERLAAGGPLSE